MNEKTIQMKISAHRVRAEMSYYDVEGQCVVDVSTAKFWLDDVEIDLANKMFCLSKNGPEYGNISIQPFHTGYAQPVQPTPATPMVGPEDTDEDTQYERPFMASSSTFSPTFATRVFEIGRTVEDKVR